MPKTVPLYVDLAQRALSEADQPATAVSALMTGASLILDRDFGPEVAAELMLAIFMQSREALIGAGLVVETTQH